MIMEEASSGNWRGFFRLSALLEIERTFLYLSDERTVHN